MLRCLRISFQDIVQTLVKDDDIIMQNPLIAIIENFHFPNGCVNRIGIQLDMLPDKIPDFRITMVAQILAAGQGMVLAGLKASGFELI